jgi:hypothetical protein
MDGESVVRAVAIAPESVASAFPCHFPARTAVISPDTLVIAEEYGEWTEG